MECSDAILRLTSLETVNNLLKPNYTPLVLLEGSKFLSHFLTVLKRECITLRVLNNVKKEILCLCVIASKTYSFNAKNILYYGDSMISLCWQRNEICLRCMTQSFGMPSSFSAQIMRSRNHMSYMAIADARGLSNTVS